MITPCLLPNASNQIGFVAMTVLVTGLVLASSLAPARLSPPDPAIANQEDAVLAVGDAQSCEDEFRYRGSFAACFSATDPPDPETIQQLQRQMDLALRGDPNSPGGRYNHTGRWPGDPGDPITLTWSFVPDWLPIWAAFPEDCNAPSTTFYQMDDLFGGDREAWISRFEQCFERWSELTGAKYVRIKYLDNDWDDGASWGEPGSETRGDIRIAMRYIHPHCGYSPGGILAYNFYPLQSDIPGIGGEMVLDRAEDWANLNGDFVFLRNIVIHEHGHGLGIAHVCPADGTKLMEPFLNTSFDGPQHDDIRAGQRQYGDPYEPNDAPVQAIDVGMLDANSPVEIGSPPPPAVEDGSMLSIDANADEDFFRFMVERPLRVTVYVAPVGHVYDSAVQHPAGYCTSGNIIDSTRFADLNVQILDYTGGVPLGTADHRPLGTWERLTVDLPEAESPYYIRVYKGDLSAEPQLYEMSLHVGNWTCEFDSDCDDGNPCNGMDLCDANGACQLPVLAGDCNNNGVEDYCDIAQNISKDCNNNDTPDECDLDDLISEDCNNNDIPDECEHGDSDGDGDVDLADFVVFQGCFVASGKSLAPCCTCVDFDDDGDMDIYDFLGFQVAYTGPNG